MKAVILNSGIGKRMKPFTDKNPKCFARVNNESLLERQMRILAQYKISDFIITTGPFESKIKNLVTKKFTKAKVAYVNNPLYESTNYIYSMHLARKLLNDDIILMHGDMIFEKRLLKRLLNSKYKDCILVNNAIKLPEKDFKARIKKGFVTEIGVNVFGKNAFFLAPVYKLSRRAITIWMDKIADFVDKGNTSVYAENAFNEVSSKIRLRPFYYQKEACTEIDNFEDLRLAQEIFNNK